MRSVASAIVHVIHLIDAARLADDVRPLCGAAGDDPTWTTVPQVVSCPACERAAALRGLFVPASAQEGGVAVRGTPRTLPLR